MFEHDTEKLNEFYLEHPYCVRIVYTHKIILKGFKSRFQAQAYAEYLLVSDKFAKSIIMVDYACGYKVLK